MVETTLAIIKPDAVQRKLVGEILGRIERSTLAVGRIRGFRMDETLAKAFYKEHEGRPYYDRLIAHTISGPCVAIELSGEDAIKRWRDWMGPTDPIKADYHIHLRGRFGTGVPANALHGSDSAEAAKREIGLVLDSQITIHWHTTPVAAPLPPLMSPLPYTIPFVSPKPWWQDILLNPAPAAAAVPEVKFKKVLSNASGINAVLPMRANAQAVGADLYAAREIFMAKGETQKISTGWQVELPPGYEGQVRPRSGLSSRGIIAMFGTIDPDYRGELIVTLHNASKESYRVCVGDRIAQLVLAPVTYMASCEVVGPLTETERGEKGFGSTGK